MVTVYVGMCADFLHHGHINIIKQARKHGKVIVGLLTDEAIATYKRVPMLTYAQRKVIVENIKGVSEVVPQKSLDYTENLVKYKPTIVVHADDWRTGIQERARQKVIETLKSWNGHLLEVPYTKNVSSTLLIDNAKKQGFPVEYRRGLLKRLLALKPLLRVMEAHNGLSAYIIDTTRVASEYYDAVWLSSFTDSLAKGKPDNETVDFTSRLATLNEILEVTTKPVIMDGDTGGPPEHFSVMVKTLERLGVSAVIIEDKVFPKQNSLMPVTHEQVPVDYFCEKIKAGLKATVTEDFLVFARVESLIAGNTVADAVKRAVAYADAGADGIMIHSNKKDANQIWQFCNSFKEVNRHSPLIVSPTTYYRHATEETLRANQVSMVIYANHLLRASIKTMRNVAENILLNRGLVSAEKLCYPLGKTLELSRKL